ncbi:MAG: hypothetical protein M0P01_00915 [Treponema sp.]|nr:hypothetical protein [Treponema sp.]
MKKIRQTILIFLCLCIFSPLLSADDTTSTTPDPYTKDEFPQFMKDARRAEIITFGAMPFVTLNTTLGYSFVRYSKHNFSSEYVPNPFAKTSDSNGFTEDEQKTILLTSIGISIGIGLTDLIVNILRRNVVQHKKHKDDTAPIMIRPIEQDKDATQIQLPPPDKINIPESKSNSDSKNTFEGNFTGE